MAYHAYWRADEVDLDEERQLDPPRECPLREFKSKGYSAPLMRYLCSIMGRDTRNVTWFKIRSANGTHY